MTNLPRSHEGTSPEDLKEVDELAELIDITSASNSPTGQTLEEIFGEPISVYTDADGIEDGTLVDLTQFTRVLFRGLPINRMTRHLFEDFKPFFEDEEEDSKKFGAKLGATLRTKLEFAQGDPGNTGQIGDIVTIPPKLWLVRNEVGGWTAMYPEDY